MKSNIDVKRKKKLPAIGRKICVVEDVEIERTEIDTILQKHKELLEESSVNRKNIPFHAVWKPEVKKARVTKPAGKYLDTLGHTEKKITYLYPEEALFLWETNSLVLLDNDEKPLNRQECYENLLNSDPACTFVEYKIFRHMCVNGFKLFRFNFVKSNSLRTKVLCDLKHFIMSLCVKDVNVFLEDELLSKVSFQTLVPHINNSKTVMIDSGKKINEEIEEVSSLNVEATSNDTRRSPSNNKEGVFNTSLNFPKSFSDKEHETDTYLTRDMLVKSITGNSSKISISDSVENHRILLKCRTSSAGGHEIKSEPNINNIDLVTTDNKTKRLSLTNDGNDCLPATDNSAQDANDDDIKPDNIPLVPSLHIYYKNHLLYLKPLSNRSRTKINFALYPKYTRDQVKNIINLMKSYNALISSLKSSRSLLEINDALQKVTDEYFFTAEIKSLLRYYFTCKLENTKEKRSAVPEVHGRCDEDDTGDSLLKSENCKNYADVLSQLQIFQEVDYSIFNVTKYLEKVKYEVYRPSSKFPKTKRPPPHYRIMILNEDEELPSPIELKAVHKTFIDKIPLLFAIVFPDAIQILRVCDTITPILF